MRIVFEKEILFLYSSYSTTIGPPFLLFLCPKFNEDPQGNLGVFLIPSLILRTASAAATMRMGESGPGHAAPVDAWIAFPGLLLLLTIMSIVGQGLFQIILVLGIAGGVEGSRVVRGAVIAIKENDSFWRRKPLAVPCPPP